MILNIGKYQCTVFTRNKCLGFDYAICNNWKLLLYYTDKIFKREWICHNYNVIQNGSPQLHVAFSIDVERKKEMKIIQLFIL